MVFGLLILLNLSGHLVSLAVNVLEYRRLLI